MTEPTLDDEHAEAKKRLVSIAEQEHNIEHRRINVTTTSKRVRFKSTADIITISTDALCFISFKDYADSNLDIRLQAGQAITLEGVNVQTVAAVTASGTANVDVIALTRLS